MPATVDFHELLDAFEWGSNGEVQGNEAYLSLETGKFHLKSEYGDFQEELPDDLYDPERYAMVPGKRDLDLGNRLVFRFTKDQMPDDYDEVRDCFRNPGAYSRFRRLLGQRDMLDAWYRYEKQATENALREWCQEIGLTLKSS